MTKTTPLSTAHCVLNRTKYKLTKTKNKRKKGCTTVKKKASNEPKVILSNCFNWLTNRRVDPITKLPLLLTDPIYKGYEKACTTINTGIENYFHDNHLLLNVYKNLGKKNGYCLLNNIDVVALKDLDVNEKYTLQDYDIILKAQNKNSSKNDEIIATTLNAYHYTTHKLFTACMAEQKLMAIPISLPNHNNFLIIDPVRSTVEHFEPHGVFGGSFDNSQRTRLKIEKAVKSLARLLFPSYEFIQPIEICPNFTGKNGYGFQAMLNKTFPSSPFNGSCTIWSLWYAHMRLSHPELSQPEVLQLAIKQVQGPVAQDFSFIEDFIKQLSQAVIHLGSKNIVKDSQRRGKKKH